MATQSLGVLTQENKTFYERTLLKRAEPNLVFAKYGQKKGYKKNEGQTINFRKFESLDIPTSPLTEGVTPKGSDLNVTDITAKVEQWGDFVEVSDVLDTVGIDPVLTETSELLGEQAGLSIDTEVRKVVTSGTNVQYANGKADTDSIAATDKITSNEIKKAVRTLRNLNAKTMDGGNYIGIVDPDVEFDIMNDPLWQDVSKYNGGVKIMDGEIGKLGGVRFITTTNTNKEENTNGVTVHSVMILGKDAYGVVDIAGSSKPEIIYKPMGSAGTADPLNQRGTVGWKAMYTAVRLNELAMVRIECAASV